MQESIRLCTQSRTMGTILFRCRTQGGPRRRLFSEFLFGEGTKVNKHFKTVEQGSPEFPPIPVDVPASAGAEAHRTSQIAAGTWIGRSDQPKVRWINQAMAGPGNLDLLVIQRFPESLQSPLIELRKLI